MNFLSEQKRLLGRIRWLVGLFIAGLVLSGVTAIPLEAEVRWLREKVIGAGPHSFAAIATLDQWLGRIHEALRDTQERHPLLFYGTDWLAFGHIVIALAFIGAWRDPVRNVWLFHFGLIACALVVPWAFVWGAVRDIPLWWRLIDCSFGVLGAIPLWLALRATRRREAARSDEASSAS